MTFYKFSILLVSFFFHNCFQNYLSLATNQEKVVLEKYIGKWYEIARLPNRFEKNCKNVTAQYSLKEESILVQNTCLDIQTNEKKVANGSAYSKNQKNTKLKVSFFRPFYGDYWILKLDKNYQYALIGSPNRKYLWILSRNKSLDKKLSQELLNYAKNVSFDISKIIWTIQE